MPYLAYLPQAVKHATQGSGAMDADKTCIDCRQGIANELPDMHDVEPTQAVGG